MPLAAVKVIKFLGHSRFLGNDIDVGQCKPKYSKLTKYLKTLGFKRSPCNVCVLAS